MGEGMSGSVRVVWSEPSLQWCLRMQHRRVLPEAPQVHDTLDLGVCVCVCVFRNLFLLTLMVLVLFFFF